MSYLFEKITTAKSLAGPNSEDIYSCLLRLIEEKSEEPAKDFALQCGYHYLPEDYLFSSTPRFDLLSYHDALNKQGVVVEGDDDNIYLIVLNPIDRNEEDNLVNFLKFNYGLNFDIAICEKNVVDKWLKNIESQMRAIDDVEINGNENGDDTVAAVITLSTINEESPVIQVVHSTIYDALKMQASDIHLECDAHALNVKYRIDGVLVEITSIQGRDIAEQIISRVKVMSDLDISERRIPQDGRFKVKVNERDVDFRVSIMPNIFGEDAVLRLLDRQALANSENTLTLDRLGIDDHSKSQIRFLAKKAHGMLLVTGPTGSGKTTTLYSALTEINHGKEKIITIEDPVEYRLPRVLQIPVNEKKGLTFAKGLRSILRHDPDKIMVGEIRDDETAQIAVQAALTGHLVFTTVHANNVFDVLSRFLHMGVDSYSFSAALNGIVAQRLLKLNCRHCLVTSTVTDEDLYSCGLTRIDVEKWTLKHGIGCDQCRGTGYKSRKAISEVLVFDDVLREMVAQRKSTSQIKEYAYSHGLVPIKNVAMDLAKAGETTLTEVARVST